LLQYDYLRKNHKDLIAEESGGVETAEVPIEVKLDNKIQGVIVHLCSLRACAIKLGVL
jgi:hypothetical protein